jgi:hypothetical protein
LQILCAKISFAVAIFLLLSVNVVASPAWAEQADAATVISSVQNTIVACYNAVKEAEAAGANITVLVSTINKAGSLLSQAKTAYATNDFDVALNLAVQSQNLLSNFIEETNTLKENATQQQKQDFLINVVGSIVGAFAVIIGGFAVWIILKKRYELTEAHISESSKV